MDAVSRTKILIDVVAYGLVPVGKIDVGIGISEIAQSSVEIGISTASSGVIVAIEGAKGSEDDLGIRTSEIDDFLEIVGAAPVAHATIGAECENEVFAKTAR